MDATGSDFKNEARRLQELFHGRFSEEEATVLIQNQGGITEAVDYISKAEPEDIRKELQNCEEKLLLDLQRDANSAAKLLLRGIETSVRQFACEECDNSWWRRVPSRKEVSKCKKCQRKFDPVPRENEWGWARFQCECGHEFSGFGQMGKLVSPCYKCNNDVTPHSIIPPNGRRGRRGQQPHSCSGVNCSHRHVTHARHDQASSDTEKDDVTSDDDATGGTDDANLRRWVAQKDMTRAAVRAKAKASVTVNVVSDSNAVCVHPSASTKRVKYPSRPHLSTGSTVATFLTQDNDVQSLADSFWAMPTIGEDDP